MPKLLFKNIYKTGKSDLQILNKESANYARIIVSISAILFGICLMGLALYISYNELDPKFPGVTELKSTIFVQSLLAIGASIVASTVFYILYTTLAEKRVLRLVTKTASEDALNLFMDKFEKVIPTTYFAGNANPTREFDEYFEPLLKNSKNYKHKGDSGNFLSYRLSKLYYTEFFSEKNISILLLDPRDCLALKEKAKLELRKDNFGRAKLDEKIESIKKDIFSTLVALYDNVSHRFNVEVRFHKELIFFRTEILDNGIFISYYLGGEFPGTYLYSDSTFVYQAFSLNYNQNYNIANYPIIFNNHLDEDKLINHLDNLECPYAIDELRYIYKKRFNIYEERVKSSQNLTN